MRNKLKILYTFCFFVFSISIFAQDSLRNANLEDSTIRAAEIISNSEKTRVNADPNIDFNINKTIDKEAIKNNTQKYSSKNDGNFLLETLPEDRDIIVKKYWAGKDVTNKKLVSNMSLGTVSTKSKIVRVECRDFGAVDGDIIKIYINEKSLAQNIVLKGSIFSVYVNLEKGYNRIDFQALNEGSLGPNTAELRLYDQNDNLLSAKEWGLATGATATIGVILKE